MVGGDGWGHGQERSYRQAVARHRGWVSFARRYRQSDLWIQAERDLGPEAEQALLEARLQVEGYAQTHPGFLISHTPLATDPLAPPVVKGMLKGAAAAGVGPMAAVAGAIAQHVGERLREHSRGVVVENGGDVYLCAEETLTVGILAGDSPVSHHLAMSVSPEEMPVGVATSAASVGHSWSYGSADAACVIADHCALADAAATALGNRIRDHGDLKPALAWALQIPGIRGALAVLGKSVAAAGRIQLVPLRD